MRRGVSTYVVFSQRLTPELLDTLHAAGAEAVEVCTARHHFDYTDRGAVRELANWFRSHPVAAAMHMPLFLADGDEAHGGEWTRYTQPTLDLISTSKHERIAAADEVKRALEAAEIVPFKSCVLHLGLRDAAWGTRALDDSLTAIEHLKAFAAPLGVQLVLENVHNAVATPEHLAEICRQGHFDTIGFCLDAGTAHLMPTLPETSHTPAITGFEQALAAYGDRLVELHLHDNLAVRDEHLWPGEGTTDWSLVRTAMTEAEATQPLPGRPATIGYLEPGYGSLARADVAALGERLRRAWAGEPFVA